MTIDQWEKIVVKELNDFVEFFKKKQKSNKKMKMSYWEDEMLNYLENN